MKINEIFHPEYRRRLAAWRLWRLAYQSGEDFIDQYLIRASQRESPEDFNNRRSITYVPSFAKAAINDIKNAIFQRIADVTRTGGHPSYLKAMQGESGGVDRRQTSMNEFIGSQVLPELLSMQRVGIYVDMPPKAANALANETLVPYIYIFRSEQIHSWAYAEPGNQSQFKSLLLCEEVDNIDKFTGLPSGKIKRYRLMYLVNRDNMQRVAVRFYNQNGDALSLPTVLELEAIPFVIAELNTALLEDAAKYQIAHMNLASSDLIYGLKSNYPFYTEQYDPRAGSKHAKLPMAEPTLPATDDSTIKISSEPSAPNKQVVEIGPSSGRLYPQGLDRPGFIHPSPEPLKASMEKQEALKKEVRLIVNLALSNMSTATASVDSKTFDDRGLEAGLSYIGLILQKAENQIAAFWNAYFSGNNQQAVVKYPTKYSLRSEEEIREENKHNKEMALTVNSLDFRRKMAYRLVETTLGARISAAELATIRESLEKSECPIYDYENLVKDVEAGVLSSVDCAAMKHYPKGTAERAQIEHSERLARIQAAQTQNAAARGNPDQGDLNGGKDEKTLSQDSAKGGKTRGDA